MTQSIDSEATATPALRSPPGRMTFEQFLEWLDEETWAEWVDGKVVVMSPVRDEHQDLAGFLLALFRFFTDLLQSGVIRHEPYVMKTSPDLPARSPDILFVATPNLSRITPTFLDGPADLVVEIVSPDSRTRDRGEKFYEYELGGVREHWLIDPYRKQAEFYLRGEDGVFRLSPVGEDGIYRSRVLDGLWIKVEWFWQRPLPSVPSVLKEWGLI